MSATDTRMETIENATRDDVRPGDHLTWERVKTIDGVTITTRYEGIARFRDEGGDWWTSEGMYVTTKDVAALTIRRPARDLPTEFGAVIVPAPGHETITATEPEGGTVWRTREAARTSHDTWLGVWRDEDGTFSSVIPAGWIDAPTWQEDDE